MSEEFFTYRGLPVLLRDILFNLMGYFYALSDNPEETLDFYARLIREHKHYVKRKEDMAKYMELGCPPECLDIAPYLYGKTNELSSKRGSAN